MDHQAKPTSGPTDNIDAGNFSVIATLHDSEGSDALYVAMPSYSLEGKSGESHRRETVKNETRCLHSSESITATFSELFEGEQDLPKCKHIFSCSLSDLKNKCLDLEPYATPCRYRFFWVNELVRRLDIYEWDSLPPPNQHFYAVPRNGFVSPNAPDRWGDFTVKGVSDPIPVRALLDNARTARAQNKYLVWSDQLCVLQSSPEDKTWQATHQKTILTVQPNSDTLRCRSDVGQRFASLGNIDEERHVQTIETILRAGDATVSVNANLRVRFVDLKTLTDPSGSRKRGNRRLPPVGSPMR